MPRVAFQGELGAFSEQGVYQLWPSGAEPVPMREFLDVATLDCAHDVGELAHRNGLGADGPELQDALLAERAELPLERDARHS